MDYINAISDVAHKPALPHSGHSPLSLAKQPHSPIFPLYNSANRISGQGVEKGLLNLSKLTVSSMLALFFSPPLHPPPAALIYPPTEQFFFCLWQKVLIMSQHDLPVVPWKKEDW